MGVMAATSKLDYLKKYMSSGDDKAGLKSKKKKKRLKTTRNLMIIDNDVKFDDRSKNDKSDDDEFDLEEEKPQVYVDGNTLLSEHNEKKGKDYKQRWAPVAKWGDTLSTVEYMKKEGDHAQKRRHDSDDDDLSPARSHVKLESPDLSPKRSQKIDFSKEMRMNRVGRGHDSTDSSPVYYKKQHGHGSPDLSPKRLNKKRYDSPDLSPKRSNRKRHDSPDLSPKRSDKKQHDCPDLSPKRSNRKRHDSPDLSPKRLDDRKESMSRKKYKDHDNPKRSKNVPTKRIDSPDLSPVRLNKIDQSPDLSPQRHRVRRAHSEDLSPVRKTNRGNCSDISLQRKLKKSSEQSPDLSPKRMNRSQKQNIQDADKYVKHEQIQSKKRSGSRREVSPEIVTSGKKAGLQSAQSLREENIRRKEFQDMRIAALENSVSGRGSGTVYRDKSGKKLDLEEERRKKKELEEKKAQDNAVYDSWKKGLHQQDEHEKKLKEDIYEMTKPLARYKDDEDLDEMLKQQERAEDPMLAFMRKNKSKSNERKKEKPRYRGPHPPANRFNIWPGYRWDGVDRSNGFEKKRFATIAEKQSVAVDAYKWSVEDM